MPRRRRKLKLKRRGKIAYEAAKEAFQVRKRAHPGHPFYATITWKILRQKVMLTRKQECVKCGSKICLQVDHIKPRSKYPELALEITNLQILCQGCNYIKGTDETDWQNTRYKVLKD